MTVATYTSDLTDIYLWESTSGVSAFGGGGAGLSASVDFAMEGTNAVDKDIDVTRKGFMYDAGTTITLGADDHIYCWLTCSTPGICEDLGMNVGDGTSSLYEYYIAEDPEPGASLVTFPDLHGECYAVRYDENPGDGTTFTDFPLPSSTPQWFGVGARMTAAVKGPNVACDGYRYGTGYDILNGTGADPEANFAGIAADDVTTSEGIFLAIDGGYRLLGKLRIGSASTACEFLDSNQYIAFKVTGHCEDDFHEILIEHASSIVNLTNIFFNGLWTFNRGRIEVLTSSATVNLTDCTFQGIGDTILGTGSTCDNCGWFTCAPVDALGAEITDSKFRNYEDAVDTSPLIWNTATDPDTKLSGLEFTKGTAATHAIEFGTSSPTTMTLNDMDFVGYNASNAQNDSTFHILRTTGTVTISIIGGSGNVSYKTAGATVVIVQNPVNLTLTIKDVGTGSAISGARVYVTPLNNTGPFPWEESVTISRVTTTATVAHTAHGMINGQLVFIEGADQPEYNGIKTISNVSVNAYDYTVSGSPTTPATGTIIATAVLINGTTNGSGIITDNRSYNAADQPISGRVRMSSSSPFYITGSVAGTVDSDNGLSSTIQLVRDE